MVAKGNSVSPVWARTTCAWKVMSASEISETTEVAFSSSMALLPKVGSITRAQLREIATLKLLAHPNVVRLHEVAASKTKIYMVLELVNGGEHKVRGDLGHRLLQLRALRRDVAQVRARTERRNLPRRSPLLSQSAIPVIARPGNPA